MGSVTTNYRFCQQSGQVNCFDDTSVIKNSLLSQPDPTQPDPALPWMRMRILDGAPHAYTAETLPHPGGPFPRTWLFFDDWRAWVQSGAVVAPAGCDPVDGCLCDTLYGCGTNLDGRLWIRSGTVWGTRNFPVMSPQGAGPFAPPTTGIRLDDVGQPSFDDLELSNHYAPLTPDRPHFAVHAGPFVPAVPLAVIYKVLPRPPLDPFGWEAPHGEAAYLLPVVGGGYGLLRPEGRALVVTDYLGTHLRSLLATPGIVWAPAAEARLTVTRGAADEGFQALAFATDGTDVADGLLREGLLAGTTADFARAAPLRPGSPSPRHDFAAVFSRSEDRAFVVGGVDDASGVEAGDIWHRAVEGQSPWTRVPLGAHRVGRVLAATWSYVDDRLWVLDEVPNAHGQGKGKSKRVRLYRIEPYLGVVSVVGDWPRQPVVDQHWLVLDLDGQVLLVTSSATAKTHLVARFEATPYDSLAPLGFSVKRRPGALVLAPIVDELGYSFAFAGPGGVPQLVRREALDLPPGGPAELEGAL